MVPPNGRRIGVAACLLAALGGATACNGPTASTPDSSPDGIPGRPTHPWGEDPRSDLSRLRYEFREFNPDLQTRLGEAAAASGPAFMAKTDWVAVWYVMRARGEVSVPPEMDEGLMRGDATQAAAFRELVVGAEVPWALANPGAAAEAYLPSSGRSLMAEPEVRPKPPVDSPPPASDTVLLGRITATLDERLAARAAEHGVPLASVAPDPSLVEAARASGSLHSDASLATFAAYEAAFVAAEGAR